MSQRILLLEDDFFLRDGLCVLLEKEGYTVQSAGTAVRPERCWKETALTWLSWM